MSLKPWHTVVTPREDLRDGRPLDASEFAVHLDHVRDGRAPAVYQEPERFFERTFLTRSLSGMACEAQRRLSGIRVATSAVFNMSTQFGGGKTHALTLLYHLAKAGNGASRWIGVPGLIQAAGIPRVPEAATAVFVGTEFDHVTGRGGGDGTPHRSTPWGEIAYQLGGDQALAVLAGHEEQRVAPAGDVIRRFLPQGPCLILMDEVMNYVSQARASGMAGQFYNFVQNLAEEARARDDMVLVVSIPASELEMNPEDQQYFDRFKKLLDRVGKAVIVSAETETSEIIRRRLFEWDTRTLTQDGRVNLPREAMATCRAYAKWTQDHREQLPHWFPVDQAEQAFAATYPFHPALLSVFERKWQTLPRFQQTRGALRLLALWVSHAFAESYRRAHSDTLLGLGTAPLDDASFRPAVFEQLGEHRLEAAITTDICGKNDSHAVRLDAGAPELIRKSMLHRKVAATIFFESHGGGLRGEATLPEIRLAVGDPELDIGNVETALDALQESCYYLAVERNRYRFSITPNLNKLHADRRSSISAGKVEERIRQVIEKEFVPVAGLSVAPFPERSNDIPDRPTLALAVVSPEYPAGDPATRSLIERMTRECGNSNRTFKSAVIWCVAEGDSAMKEDARKLLAWEAIRSEEKDHLDDAQKRQLDENVPRAVRDLKERVWQAYRHVLLLDKDNAFRAMDLGRSHSSSAVTLAQLVVQHLRSHGEIEESVGPGILTRNWPPAQVEWSTRKVRNDFFASPQFPRLLNGDVLKETIANGARDRFLAYVSKAADGSYDPFWFGCRPGSVELSDDCFIISRETAEAYEQARQPPPGPIDPPIGGQSTTPGDPGIGTGTTDKPDDNGGGGGDVQPPEPTSDTVSRIIRWHGEVPNQKWTTFYTRVLSRFARDASLQLRLEAVFEIEGDVPSHKLEETRAALRELGLSDDVG